VFGGRQPAGPKPCRLGFVEDAPLRLGIHDAVGFTPTALPIQTDARSVVVIADETACPPY